MDNRFARGESFIDKGAARFPCSFVGGRPVYKTAVLIDAGFLRAFLPKKVPGGFKTMAGIIEDFALACVLASEDEQMQRVLYYDSPPYDNKGASKKQNPLDPTRLPASLGYQNFNNSVLTTLKSRAYLAVRLGEMSFDGWAISEAATADILATKRNLVADDFKAVLRQKGVDLRIGLDVALMAKDRLIDRIVVVTGDSDIIPAMKVARREGVQVVLASLLNTNAKASLREHADLYRHIDLQAIIDVRCPKTTPPATPTVPNTP